MTLEEAYKELGVQPGASKEEIKAAYRVRVKATHPDTNGGGANAEEEFRRVQQAYDILSGGDVQTLLDAFDPDEEDDGQADEPNNVPATIHFVRSVLSRDGIEILFDGSLHRATDLRMASGPDEIEAFLAIKEIDECWLIDKFIFEAPTLGMKVTKSDLERALRAVSREDRQRRRNMIALPLLKPLLGSERANAEVAWRTLAHEVFVTDSELVAACLQHLMWQVKQKLLRRPVKHHLMPVIWSPDQGSGKTTFVAKLVSPLRELAVGPVLLSDFVDARSGDIYRFAVLIIDDMQEIQRSMIPVLKSLLTSEGLWRRRLGTSMTQGYQQRTTLIGTANAPIDVLVADETGHRRFASLRFRNGKIESGGDAAVWAAVDATDYDLLWRSVDAFGPPPIEAHLAALVALQKTGRTKDPVLMWLRSLDVLSERVKRITVCHGIRASDLHDLYCEQDNTTLSITRFGEYMRIYVSDASVPFGSKVKKTDAWYYPLKNADGQSKHTS